MHPEKPHNLFRTVYRIDPLLPPCGGYLLRELLLSLFMTVVDALAL